MTEEVWPDPIKAAAAGISHQMVSYIISRATDEICVAISLPHAGTSR